MNPKAKVRRNSGVLCPLKTGQGFCPSMPSSSETALLKIHMEQLVQIKTDCIISCQRTYGACMAALTRCLQPEQTRLLLDCAESCHISASFLLRESPSAGYFCSVAARLCERCAAECERLGEMEQCVEACRKSAVLCHRMGKIPPEGI